jgi:hypothetical protein
MRPSVPTCLELRRPTVAHPGTTAASREESGTLQVPPRARARGGDRAGHESAADGAGQRGAGLRGAVAERDAVAQPHTGPDTGADTGTRTGADTGTGADTHSGADTHTGAHTHSGAHSGADTGAHTHT